MNVAIFSDCYLPIKNGVVTSINQLKEGMEGMGHRVAIVTVDVPGCDKSDPNVFRVPTVAAGMGSEQRFAGWVNKGKVLKFLEDYKIDIVHTHTEFSLGSVGHYVAKKLKVPHVQTTHTMWEEYRHYVSPLITRGMTRAFLKAILKPTDVVVSPSIKAKKYFSKLVPNKIYRVIPNGIDMAKFKTADVTEQEISDLRQKYGIKLDDKLLIFVGRIGQEKRVDELFDAMVPVIKQNNHVKLVYVGDGPALVGLKEKAKKLDMEHSFIFTGFINWAEVYKLYSISDVFVTTSLSEVHPMTLIESAICGLSAVVRRDDSYVDLVHEGVNGHLVDSEEEMTQRVNELINDDAKLKKFSDASLEISKLFSAENHVKRMVAYYEEVVRLYPDRLREIKDAE